MRPFFALCFVTVVGCTGYDYNLDQLLRDAPLSVDVHSIGVSAGCEIASVADSVAAQAAADSLGRLFLDGVSEGLVSDCGSE
jgi:hypothetical protein